MRNTTILLAVMAVLAVSVSAYATDYDWNTGDGAFGTAGNWDPATPAGPPGSGDTAIFGTIADPAYTVTFGGTVTNNYCYVKTDKVILDLNSNVYNLVGGGISYESALYVGDASGETGVLTIDDTSVAGGGKLDLVSKRCKVGSYGDGTITVQGGAELELNDYLYVGPSGSTHTGTGKFTVTGAGSRADLLYFEGAKNGTGGSATIEVLDGGLVTTTKFGLCGTGAAPTATVKVDGTDSRFQIKSSLAISGKGNVTMDIQNGGKVYTDSGGTSWMLCEYSSSGTAVVNVGLAGTGILDTNGGAFTLGTKGTVNVGAGGTVTTGNVTVKSSSTVPGTINMKRNSAVGWAITGALTCSGALHFEFDETLDGNGRITATGTADITGADMVYTAPDGFSPNVGDTFDFITAGSITGFDATDSDNMVTLMTGLGYTENVDYTYGVVTGSDILQLEIIPEPATLALLGLGGIGVLLRRRKK